MKKPRLKSKAPIIHDSQLAHKMQLWMEHEGSLKNAFKMPDGLSIFTAHNYDKKSLFERNLDFLGIHNYHVIKINMKPWNHTLRIKWFLEYLINDCKTELVLYCDADDVILRSDPKELIKSFEYLNCKLIYNSTSWPHGYKCMPEIFDWVNKIHPKRYLNGGVFLGNRTFLISVLKRFLQFTVNNPPSTKYFYENELEFKESFPKGVGCDQPILRYIEPEFYPNLIIDSQNLLFWRNDNKTEFQILWRKIKRMVPENYKRPFKKIIGL